MERLNRKEGYVEVEGVELYFSRLPDNSTHSASISDRWDVVNIIEPGRYLIEGVKETKPELVALKEFWERLECRKREAFLAWVEKKKLEFQGVY